MVLDEQIKQALERNSEWRGSADRLWANISQQLLPKRPWWQRQRFWLGTLAAAALVLALFLRPAVPPETPEPKSLSLRQAPASPMLVGEAASVAKGEPVEIALAKHFLAERESAAPARLLIWKTEEAEPEKLWHESPLNPSDLLGRSLLTTAAPNEAGDYRLVVQGVFEQDGQNFMVCGEARITVLED